MQFPDAPSESAEALWNHLIIAAPLALENTKQVSRLQIAGVREISFLFVVLFVFMVSKRQWDLATGQI